ncbi:MAG: CHAT domain-containing protein [Theionarchaea archaeon]|nr:CHAT domain-containing protein [Theionarchaea archaeon]
MNWEKIIVQGIKKQENLSDVLSRAIAAAPADIREILEHLPDTLHFSKEIRKNFQNKGGSTLVLLHYYWLSGCGEFSREFPLEMQQNILRDGLEASIAGRELASTRNEPCIEARFLSRAANILHELGRFTEADDAFTEALAIYRELAEKNPSYKHNVAATLNNLGTLYAETGAFSKAETAYTKALEIYKELEVKIPECSSDVAMTEYNLGTLYRKRGKFSKAEAAYTKALRIYRTLAAENSEYRFNMVMTLNQLGILFWSTHKYLEAETAYMKALKEFRELVKVNPDKYLHHLAMVLSNLGVLCADTKNFQKAEEFHLGALKISKELAEKNPVYLPEVARTLGSVGNFYDTVGYFQKGEDACGEALKILETLSQENSHAFDADKAAALNNLGVIYWHAHQFSQAEQAYTEALEIYNQLSRESPGAYTPDVAMTLNNLGALHRDCNRFLQAEQAYTEALEIYKKLSRESPGAYTPDVAMTLNNLGGLYLSIHRFLQAEQAYKKALTIYEELAKENFDVYALQIGTTTDNLGSLYRHAHRLSQAEQAYTKALALYQELADKNPGVYRGDVAAGLNNLGTHYWNTNQFSQAEQAYTKALTIYKELAEENQGYTADVAMTLNNLGALYCDTKEFRKAENVLTKTLELYRQLVKEYAEVYSSDMAMALNNLGIIHQRRENFRKAENVLTEALELYKTLAEKYPDAFDHYVVTALNNLAHFYQRRGDHVTAEKVFGETLAMAKERALWFQLAEICESLSQYDNRIEDAVRALELGILFSGEKKYKYAQKGRREDIYLEFLEKTDDPQKMYGILEALRDSDLLCLEWDSKNIDELRNENLQKTVAGKMIRKEIPPRKLVHIPSNVLFLYIQEMKHDILYLAVTHKGIHVSRGTSEFVRIGQRILENLRVQMLGEVFRKDISGIITKCDHLAAQWWYTIPEDIQEVISQKDTIIFSPDQVISYFPLEGLTDGEPMCLSKNVLRATSMQLQKTVPKMVDVNSSLIIGNPWPVEEPYLGYRYSTGIYLGYLASAAKEAETLAETLPHPEVLLTSQVTADRFLEGLSDCSLIHFAGHGHEGRVLFFAGPMSGFPPEFEPEEFSELRKAWRLSNGKTVYMMDEWDIVTDVDILNTPLKEGILVFLNACETGKHKYAGGGHFQGLAQAFLKRGASNVISSLVPLYGAPARNFAASFYDNLLCGQPVTTALQNTRERIRKEYTAHVYWLPYIHYGFLI